MPGVSRWAANGTSVMSGRSFVNALHVRAACLYTKARASRGRVSTRSGAVAAGVRCEVCPYRRENLSHVLQQCPRSAHARTQRHDTVAKLLTKGLTARGYTVQREPAIRTDHGVRRPDVVAYKPGESAVIIDVTVVADIPGGLSDAYARKCRKYDDPQVRAWAAERAGVHTASVTVSALTFNWRVALCAQSALDMKRLGISMPMLEVMSIRVLEWGHSAWRESRNATWVRMDPIPRDPVNLRGASGQADGTRRHHLGARPPRRRGPPVSLSRNGRTAGGRWSHLRDPDRTQGVNSNPVGAAGIRQ